MTVNLLIRFFSKLEKKALLCILLFLLTFQVSAQIISTVAGSSTDGNGGPATEANLHNPSSIAVDVSGNIFIADRYHSCIRKVALNGIITIVAGNGGQYYSGDGGLATNATLYNPTAVALDRSGNLFIADYFNNRIRKVARNGIITTVAGNGTNGFSGDGGPATNASLAAPTGLAVDANGNLFIADPYNGRIRKVDTKGTITTIAGTGIFGFSGDGGLATNADLRYPYGVAVDANGNLFIADLHNHRIRKVTSNGIITTVAGLGESAFSGDGGPAIKATLSTPYGVTVDVGGNLFIADYGNSRIRKVDADGMITTIAGDGTHGFSGDGGLATRAALNKPYGVVLDAGGNLFIADEFNHRIRKVTTNGIISTVAGNGTINYSGDNGLAISANIGSPYGLTVDKSGNLFMADADNHRIRKIATNGIITTVAGNGISGYSGDGGLATKAQLYGPTDVTIDASGNLYIADASNNRIRKVTTDGIITTIAGSGVAGFNGDGGPATQASLAGPYAVAIDAKGSFYISDANNHRIRKVGADGIITTVAGNGKYSMVKQGDGGPATKTSLISPMGLTVDANGNLFIAVANNNCVRRVSPEGIITTVAGDGTFGFRGDGGPATRAQLYGPTDVAMDASGSLYITDHSNKRIRKVSTDGTMNTIAGTGTWGSNGNGNGGPATSANLGFPYGIVVDGNGNFFFTETVNRLIRRVSAPVQVSGNLDGHLYGADCSTFQGWVWDRNKPNTPITVDILDGGTVLATITADEFRQDLIDAGKGNGKHAFRYTIPTELKNGLAHSLSARVTGTGFSLKSGPKAITCQPVNSPPNQAPLPPTIAGLTAQVGVAFSSSSLEAFKDPEGSTLTYTLTGLPNNLMFSTLNRIISGTPTQAGSFTLVYTATDPQSAATQMSIPLTIKPASATAVVGSFEGFLENVECGAISGWAWDKAQPNTPIMVEFYTGSTVWGSILADRYRPDLKSAGKGNGVHAYSFEVPKALKDGQSRLVRARVLNSSYELKWSGKVLTCPSATRLSVETASALSVTILENPVLSDHLTVEVRGASDRPLHLQLREIGGRLLSERSLENAGVIEKLSLPVKPSSAGLLLLRVTSGQQNLTLKVVKP